ncbi:FAD-dependent monooxygenase [Spirilliplanes yamanashiensis]|uniref:Monooxygenase n=1 Tax=Spirilliplanes yamanashiensis TaxID=42233 RepID=A0A8J3YDI9_9ACTN|nr:FAD-dependent monooxygenase [Spirilliplanes yamanashiensis]MDP9816229.1 FAD-dependent urate hydroxylase [Spirilliplanes yamanashiensis]GIJ05755.1 monooxygenase [Spirilliplanes yamanashiensis]
MSGSSLRILVVGAGISGLAAARALRLAGFRPDVVEELPASMVPGAGIHLPGNAARALRALGLEAPLRPLGERFTRQIFLDAQGRELCAVDVAALWAGVGESRALPRADLQRVLLSAVGGQVRYETAVKGLDIGDRTAKVEFGDGGRAEYDLVVAADGRKSTVRGLAELGGAAQPTGQTVYRSVVTGGPAVGDWVTLLGRRCGFTIMPMGGGRLYLYADETADAPPSDGLARVRELYGGFGGPVPAVLDALTKVQVARTDEVVTERWSRGPVLLVGDAAHATSPSLAQGAAMALEDAVVLGEVLGAALHDTPGDVPAALAEYERRRRPRTGWVHERTRERDRARDVPPALRDPLLRRRGDRIFADHYRALVEPM